MAADDRKTHWYLESLNVDLSACVCVRMRVCLYVCVRVSAELCIHVHFDCSNNYSKGAL